nr:hypothetical protein [Tanacetum cinerariifolium]
MSTLKFAEVHNLVAFLSKPSESEGFEQIFDFLNENPIQYALMVNPTVYILCIEQFWTIAKAKTINEEGYLQALVDGKKILIIESTVRRDLQLEDDEGVDCLPNAAIFEQLTLMGYEIFLQKLTFYKALFSSQWKFLIHAILQCLSSKTAAWNEFSSTIASVIICLATNQKFNFSNYIVESMMKNLDNMNKFFMYPRFVQVFLDKQLEGMSNHNRIYVAPSHTEKIFGNMRRVGKGFSRRETPLFPTMMVQAQEKIGGVPRCQETMGDTIAQTMSENVSKFSNDSLLNRVLDLETTKTTQAMEIESLKRMVKKLEKKQRSRTYKHKRLYKGRISDIDADEDITLVSTHNDAEMFDTDKDLHGEEVFVVKQDENVVEKEVDAAQVQHTKPKAKAKGIVFHELEESTTTTAAIPKPKLQDKGKAKMIEEPVKLKKKDQIMLDEEVALKLQAKLHTEFDKEQRIAREKAQKEEEEAKIMFDRAFKRVNIFVDFRTELVEDSSKKAEAEVMEQESLKRAGTELDKESSKKQKIDDDKEIAELKYHMHKYFDREDVETLWKLVKAKHGSTRPKEGYERVLWVNLKCRGNQGNQVRGRTFMLGAEEARHDLSIMTGIEPSDLGFNHKIEIASGKLVEIDKVIRGYKLEIEGYVFDINLIPFGSGSFDVIIGMDWLFDRKAKIICHEKVVMIPLLDGKVLGLSSKGKKRS